MNPQASQQNKLRALMDQYNESESAVMKKWFDVQDLYYNSMASDELSKLRAQVKELLESLRIRDKELLESRSAAEAAQARVTALETQVDTIEATHAEAMKTALDEAARNNPSRGRSRGRSRGQSRGGSSVGAPAGQGGNRMNAEEIIDMVDEYRTIAKSASHIAIITRQLQQAHEEVHSLKAGHPQAGDKYGCWAVGMIG